MNFFNKSFHRSILEKLLDKYKHLLSGAIVDIGSKNRPYDHLFLQSQITAVDLFEDKDKNIIYGNIEGRLPFKDQSFDGVLCLEVFEYLQNYSQAFSEIHRILKPEKYAIITTPFMYCDHGDNVRFTQKFFNKEAARYFEIVTSLKIGNTYSVLYDIVRRRIVNHQSKITRYILWFIFLPWFLGLKILFPFTRTDDCYSGIFVVLKKKI